MNVIKLNKKAILKADPSSVIQHFCEYGLKLFDFDNADIKDEFWIISTVGIRDTSIEQIIDFLICKDENIIIPTDNFNYENKYDNAMDKRIYALFFFQLLSYLCSYKPDIVENEVTKKAYVELKPKSKPQNNLSEIQAYDVGYKIGSAFRSWKKASASCTTASLPTGRKVRPHAVRAHWRRQWFGPKGNQEQRLIWINEFYTGIKTTENPAIIHKVKE